MVTEQKLKHSPTLRTIKMVEETLKNMDESLITVAELKKILPRKVNHNTLIEILEYLEENGKIYVSVKGITWVQWESEEIDRLIKHGRRI